MAMKKYLGIVTAIIVTVNIFGQQVFDNYQEAVTVIGQPDFKSLQSELNTFITLEPVSVAISSKGMLAVADRKGGSVKIWYKIPEKDGQPADVEVGNPGFTESNNGPTESYAASFESVAWSPDGNKLIATCGTQNRVLIWNSIPQKNGQAADVVLGQTDFYSTKAGTSEVLMNNPSGILITPDGKLLVSDCNNNRVLIWNSIPVSNATPADNVIGQPNFNSSLSGVSRKQLNMPRGLSLSPEGRLLVTSTASHHVSVFDSVPASSYEAATLVIGKTDFAHADPGTSDSSLNLPAEAKVFPDNQMAIADYANNRMLIFNKFPETNGAHANVVLGQPDFFSGSEFYPTGTPDNKNMSSVYSVASDLNGRLFVAGSGMQRVMVFGKLPDKYADLSVSIESSSNALCELSNLVCEVKIYNAGPDIAYNIVTTAAFPAYYVMENFNASTGIYNKKSGYWKIPQINPGETVTLKLRGYVKSGTNGKTVATYVAIIASSAIDINLLNNSNSFVTTILSNTLPANPVTKDATSCSGSGVTLYAAPLSNAKSEIIQWFTSLNDLAPITTGYYYKTGVLYNDTVFYVSTYSICPGSSRIPVKVSVKPSYLLKDTLFICRGASVTFPDKTTLSDIQAPLSHNSNFKTMFGCDSIIITTVLLYPDYYITESLNLCNGEVIVFPDGTISDTLKEDISHTSYLVSVNGCDSIINTFISIKPKYFIIDSIKINMGSVYRFPDGTLSDTLTKDTEHTSLLVSVNGCDSIILTRIKVKLQYIFEENISICYGSDYIFPDGTIAENIQASMEHNSNFISSQGNDSIIITHIEITKIDPSVIQNGSELTAQCTDASYQWVDCNNGYFKIPGQTFQSFKPDSYGSYAVILSKNGCTITTECYVVSPSNINESALSPIKSLYPNPFRDNVLISFSKHYNNVLIEITNISNHLLLRQAYKNVQGTINLNSQNIPAGFYLIRITADNENNIFKVFKE
jgi:hypothetical protein